MNRFDQLDTAIINEIATAERNTTDIAQRLNVGRKTMRYRLERLLVNNQVRQRQNGREILWSATRKQSQGRGVVRVYQKNAVTQAFHELSGVRAGSIVYTTQGFASLQDDMKWLPYGTLKKYHDTLKRKQIKIISCTPHDSLTVTQGFNTKLLESLLDRSVGITMLTSRRSLQGWGGVFVAEHFIGLVNSKVRRWIIIKDEQIAQILHESFAMLFQTISEIDNTRTVDLNTFIRKELEQRGQ